MFRTSTPGRRWRRTALATAGVSLIAAVAPMIGANPAGAATAPLTTTEGLGVRVDQNAILGPALELIEDSIQPFANQMIYNGALANSPAGTPKSLHVSSNVELGFNFVNAGTTGYPQGGLKVHADIQNIEIRYIKDPVWPFADCSIWVRPDTATIDASAKINTALLPNAPLQLNPITAWWDDDPSVTSDGVCWWWLIDDFFDNLFTSGGTSSVARTIEAELNGQAQGLINDLWVDHVLPVVNSLNEFGITFNTIKTDAYGLIVTANMNLSGGLTIPGLGGPFPVGAAEDSGVTNNVNTVLANRGEVIVSVHPNIVNQFLTGLNVYNGGYWAADYLGAGFETTLFGAPNATYRDNGWYYELTVGTGQPHVKPTGTGGAPQLQHPQAILSISHEDVGLMAEYRGAIGAINLRTVIRPENNNHWGPDFSATSMTQSMTRTYTGAGVTATPATILPTLKTAVAKWNADTFETFVNLAPISIGGLPVTVCTACTRYAGDQRYTIVFNVA